jgi:hypothetical protein
MKENPEIVGTIYEKIQDPSPPQVKFFAINIMN